MSTTDYGTILATMISGAGMRRKEISRTGDVSTEICESGDSDRIAVVDVSIVFQAWRGIECLAGACSAAMILGSSPSESDTETSMKTLLRPTSTQRNEIIKNGPSKDIYALASIPNPISLRISKTHRETVDFVYAATLNQMKDSMLDIQRLAKLIHGPRHSYAHNYRFMPLKCPEPIGGFLKFDNGQEPVILQVQGNPSMIGVLDEKARPTRLLITEDDRDELITRLYMWAEIEGWIYQNMINTIENGKAILPSSDSFLFALDSELADEYSSLRSKLGHISHPKIIHGWGSVKVRYNPSRKVKG